MGLEFPRREVQQSREYNVARVRGGYYLSDKDGDALTVPACIRARTRLNDQQLPVHPHPPHSFHRDLYFPDPLKKTKTGHFPPTAPLSKNGS
jgi:hypothetical protein